MSAERRVWMGATQCDFCNKKITGVLFDAKTLQGPWATMCGPCFRTHSGTNWFLGTGKGQRYVQEDTGEFVKVEG